MRIRKRLQLILVCGSLSSVTGGMEAESPMPFTYPQLVERLTNVEFLATLPAPGETAGLFSSFDRASRYDAGRDRYIQWRANDDGTGILRKEGQTLVLAEMDGPGCLWRIWTATAGKGHVKIYLDGAPSPTVDLAFEDYFNGKAAPFDYPALAYRTQAFGYNNYVPIPYQKSCKIVAEEQWGEYYQFTYTTFPRGTVVPTFTMRLDAANTQALQQANEKWGRGLGTDPAGTRTGAETVTKKVKLEAGQKVEVAHLRGAQAITGLEVQWDEAMDLLGPEEWETLLRATTLSIRWDGQKEPSVWSPLGDFFGTGPGLNEFRGLLSGLSRRGAYAFWYMPFAREAVIELFNESAQTLELEWRLTCAPLTQPVETLGRFHAKWHRDAFGQAAAPERDIDWTLLKTRGRGRFCGVMLNLWNPCGAWWGEGDEKFFVDGEKFPSMFGTGSEDYFGYAWCGANIFSQALHNQTRNNGKHEGQIAVARWQVQDNVPFQAEFEGSIEKYFNNRRPTQYACVAYWYQDAGSTDVYPVLPLRERVGYQEPPFRVADAVEGESLTVAQKPKGKSRWNVNVNDLAWTKHRFSNSTFVSCKMAGPGDRVTFLVPVARAGRYQIFAQFVKNPGMGIVQMAWNGVSLGEPLDAYAKEWQPSGEVLFGTLDLPAGENRMQLEIFGKNAQSRDTEIGLDYVRLAPVP